MKRTLICIHVMPMELEMFERTIIQFKRSLLYLDDSDEVTFKITLNLNPQLTNWDDSEYKQNYFVNRFNSIISGLNVIDDIVLNESCWGTTQQKREAISLNYDQFIFCDTDILFHETLLKYQLNLSYQLNGIYIISPSVPRWWDSSWDLLCHSDYLDYEIGYAQTPDAANNVFVQSIDNVEVRPIPLLKFGCGMHTLYSKSFWDFVGIPNEFGGYGPEDSFAVKVGNIAIKYGYEINQYVLDGIYITEDYINRTPTFANKITPIDRKKEFYESALKQGVGLVSKFVERIVK